MSSFKKIFFNLSLYLFFVLVCVTLAIYTESSTFLANTSYLHSNINSFQFFFELSATQFASLFGLADIASYIKAAEYLLQNGHFQPPMIALWPPGFPIVIAALLKFTGESNYPIKMISITIMLWPLALLFFYHALPNIQRTWGKIVLVSLPLYFETFRLWIFGLGPFMSEAIALPLFVISLSFFTKWLQSQQNRDLIWMAIFFSMGAYFRGYFELLGNFIIFVIFSSILLALLFSFLKTRFHSPAPSLKHFIADNFYKKNYPFNVYARIFLLASIIFFLLLLPWRFHMHRIFNSFSWQQLNNIIWTTFWTPGKLYFPDANLACNIQPGLCQILSQDSNTSLTLNNELYRNLTLLTFFTHPLIWYTAKIKYLNALWFSSSEVISWQNLLTDYKWLFLEGCLIFLSGIIVILSSAFIWLRQNNSKMKILFIFSLLILFFNIILFTFFHFEPRYSLFMKIYFIYSPLMLLVIYKEKPFNEG